MAGILEFPIGPSLNQEWSFEGKTWIYNGKGWERKPDTVTSKQDTLISGQNIKTINGVSILGTGDLVISEGGVSLGGDMLKSDYDTPPDGVTFGTVNNSRKLGGHSIDYFVVGNPAITGKTGTKIKYDSKGLVLESSSATCDDIVDGTDYHMVSTDQRNVLNNTSGVNTGDKTLSDLEGVPTTRKINNKALTGDITLNASDLGIDVSDFQPLLKDSTINTGSSGVIKTINGVSILNATTGNTDIVIEGTPGIPGIDGKMILSGIINPTLEDGEVGDLYWNYATKTLFGPKESDDWGTGIPLNGVDGKNIELQKSSTHIQWRVVGDVDWIDLVLLTDLKGDQGLQGIQGDQGIQGPKGDTGLKGDKGDTGAAGADGLTTSVNGKTQVGGAITLVASDIGARDKTEIGDAHGFINPPNTGNFTLSNIGSSVTVALLVNAGAFKINGTEFLAREMSIIFTASLGQNFIFCKLNSGVPQLYSSPAPWDIMDLTAIPVCTVNWDGTNAILGDELHSASRNLIQHKKEHDTDGARWVSGFVTTFASASNTFSAATGKLRDEERYHEIGNKTTCRISYRNPARTAMISDAASTEFAKLSGGIALWDNNGTPTQLDNNNYGTYYLYATNRNLPADSELVCVMGQGEYTSISAAQTAAQPTLAGMSVAEWKLLYVIIIRRTNALPFSFIQADDKRLVTTGLAVSGSGLTSLSASQVTFAPTGNISATNVQSALQELDDEKKPATYKGAYDSEVIVSPTTGTLNLKNWTETFLNGSLANANIFTVALPDPTSLLVNESILIFKIGGTLPTITQPSGIIYRGSTPTLAVNTNWTFVYEQVYNGTTWEIWASSIKNV